MFGFPVPPLTLRSRAISLVELIRQTLSCTERRCRNASDPPTTGPLCARCQVLEAAEALKEAIP